MSEYTAGQVERAAQDWETFGATDAPAMLRAYAATLRQQAERGDGAVSDEVAHVARHMALAVEYIEKQYPNARQLDRGPIMRNLRRWRDKLLAVAPLLRARAETESKVYVCPRCATSMQVDPSAKPRAPAGHMEDARCPPTYRREEAVKTLIALGWAWDGKDWIAPTPAEQGGRVDEDAAIGKAYRRWYAAAKGFRDVAADAAHEAIMGDAALAQNAQGEAAPEVYGGPFGARYIACLGQTRLPVGTKLYLHAERAMVPAVNGRRFVAWMIDNREGCRVTEEGLHGWLAEFLREESAAPSQPENASHE